MRRGALGSPGELPLLNPFETFASSSYAASEIGQLKPAAVATPAGSREAPDTIYMHRFAPYAPSGTALTCQRAITFARPRYRRATQLLTHHVRGVGSAVHCGNQASGLETDRRS